MKRVGIVATAIWLMSLGLVVAALLVPNDGESPFLFVAAVPGYGTAGAIVAAKRPRNPTGWILLALALVSGVASLAWVVPSIPFDVWAVGQPCLATLIGLFFLVLPDGKFGRTTPIAIVLGASWFIAGVFQWMPAIYVGVLSLIACVVVAVRRYVKADDGLRRRMRPVVFAAAGSAVLAAAAGLAGAVGGTDGIVVGILGLGGFLGVFAMIPLGIGIAITRYRLYEIDRLINRTVVYAVVAGVSAGVFVGATLAAPALLPDGAGEFVVAGATLVVFFMFRPLRVRTQHFVDRRFYRSRYEPERVSAEMSARLRNQVHPDQVGAEWATIVSATMQPARSAVWIRP